MSGKMIVEVPDSHDSGACGQDKLKEWPDPVAWLQKTTGRRCSLLGRVERQTSHVPSHVILVDGAVSRVPNLPYWGCKWVHPMGRDYRLDYDGEHLRFLVRSEEVRYVPGIHLVSLMKLGRLTWPKPSFWVRSAARAIESYKHHADPGAHNMIWGPEGLRLVDEERSASAAMSRVEMRFRVRRHIMAWWRGATAVMSDGGLKAPDWLVTTMLLAKDCLRKVLPRCVVRFLKRVLYRIP
jgi:hypothetical protein